MHITFFIFVYIIIKHGHFEHSVYFYDINTNIGILKTISNELWLSTLISSVILIYVSNSITLIIQGVFGVILPFVCLLSSCHARRVIVKLVRVDLHI